VRRACVPSSPSRLVVGTDAGSEVIERHEYPGGKFVGLLLDSFSLSPRDDSFVALDAVGKLRPMKQVMAKFVGNRESRQPRKRRPRPFGR
jgi:hypothetical protein